MDKTDIDQLLAQIASGSVAERREALAALDAWPNQQLQANAAKLVPVLVKANFERQAGVSSGGLAEAFTEVRTKAMLLARAGPTAAEAVRLKLEHAMASNDGSAFSTAILVACAPEMRDHAAVLLPALKQAQVSPLAAAQNKQQEIYGLIRSFEKGPAPKGCGTALIIVLGTALTAGGLGFLLR